MREAGKLVLEGLEPGSFAGNPDFPPLKPGRLLGGSVFLGTLRFFRINPSVPGPTDVLAEADP